MERIRDNKTYRDFAICPRCGEETCFHVTDIRGSEEKYIICPNCGARINLID